MFNGDWVSVWEDEKVLEMGGGNGCTTQGCQWKVHLKIIKMVNFMLHIFYSNEKLDSIKLQSTE